MEVLYYRRCLFKKGVFFVKVYFFSYELPTLRVGRPVTRFTVHWAFSSIMFENNNLDQPPSYKSWCRVYKVIYRCNKWGEKTLFSRCSITCAVFSKWYFLKKWQTFQKIQFFHRYGLSTLRVERPVTRLIVHSDWALYFSWERVILE